jgi:hypothetical protein
MNEKEGRVDEFKCGVEAKTVSCVGKETGVRARLLVFPFAFHGIDRRRDGKEEDREA